MSPAPRRVEFNLGGRAQMLICIGVQSTAQVTSFKSSLRPRIQQYGEVKCCEFTG